MSGIARQSPSGRVANALLRGVGLTLNADLTLSPLSRPRYFYDWDYFLEGVTSPCIGRMGWTLTGAGATITPFNFASIVSPRLSLNTLAVANAVAALTLGNTASGAVCSPLECADMSMIWRVGTPTTSKRAFFGWCDDFAVNPLVANNALGINYDSEVSAGFQLISRANGLLIEVKNAALPSIPPAIGSQMQALTIVQSAAGHFDFYSNDYGSSATLNQHLVGSVESPGFAANLGWRSETLTTTAQRMDLAYWGINTMDLAGVLSSDDFLEL